MLQFYLVTYDIREPKRLRKVFKIMRAFGDHLQYSVFRCVLSPANKVRLLEALGEVIHHKEDQVLIFHLGPIDGMRTDMIEYLGQTYLPSEHDAVIV